MSIRPHERQPTRKTTFRKMLLLSVLCLMLKKKPCRIKGSCLPGLAARKTSDLTAEQVGIPPSVCNPRAIKGNLLITNIYQTLVSSRSELPSVISISISTARRYHISRSCEYFAPELEPPQNSLPQVLSRPAFVCVARGRNGSGRGLQIPRFRVRFLAGHHCKKTDLVCQSVTAYH